MSRIRLEFSIPADEPTEDGVGDAETHPSAAEDGDDEMDDEAEWLAADAGGATVPGCCKRVHIKGRGR